MSPSAWPHPCKTRRRFTESGAKALVRYAATLNALHLTRHSLHAFRCVCNCRYRGKTAWHVRRVN